MTDINDPLLDHLGRVIREDIFPVGLRIDDRYEIRHRITRGGMGEIFAAWDRKLDRPVAMKVLVRALSTPEWAARFEAETHTMATIEHPGIVPIYDRGQLPDGRLYFAMKLVEGRTFEEGGELLEPLARAAEVVQFAHERGVLHRDLKPANLMIDAQGHVYVLDWGLSGAQTGGTAEYMAPEQEKGAEDRRVDIYALGAILYRLLTGRLPGKIAPRLLDPSIPQDIEAVCLRAMSPERYPSARDFADDLRRAIRGEPVAARPRSIFERAWGRRRPAALVTLAILVAVGAAVTYHRRVSRTATAVRLLEEARALIDRDIDEAEHLVERAMKLDPDLALGPYLQGQISEARGWDDRAEQCWRRALELDPKFDRARYRLARLAIRRVYLARLNGVEDADAVGELESAKIEDPISRDIAAAMLAFARHDLAALRGLAEAGIRRWKGSEGEEEFHWLLGHAVADEAQEEAWDRAIRIQPRFPLALFSRGFLRQIRGDAKAAKADYDEAIRLNPRFAEAYLNRGRLGKDVADLDRALEIRPGFARAWMTRGVMTDTLADLDEAIRLAPTLAEAWAARGVLREKNDPAGAIADYDAALALKPTAEIHYNRGVLRHRNGDYPAAIRDYTDSIALQPDFASVWLNRGVSRKMLEDFDGAIGDFTRALAIDPKFVEAWFNRGFLHQTLADWDAARGDYDAVLRLDPKNYDVYFLRARVRRIQEDEAGAKEDVRKALEYAPADWPYRRRAELLLEK